MPVRVVFICLGNICRSPMAEGVFRQLVDEAGLTEQFEIDSAGTSAFHEGEPPHAGTQQVLRAHGVPVTGRSRQVVDEDFDDDDAYLIAMDKRNVDQLFRRFGDHPGVARLLDYATQTSERNVPDPYYSGNFETVYDLVEDGCRGLLAHIRAAHDL